MKAWGLSVFGVLALVGAACASNPPDNGSGALGTDTGGTSSSGGNNGGNGSSGGGNGSSSGNNGGNGSSSGGTLANGDDATTGDDASTTSSDDASTTAGDDASTTSGDDASQSADGAPACGPSNCTGCCNILGACVGGTDPSACGASGGACQTCVGTQACTGGVCTGGDAGANMCANLGCFDIFDCAIFHAAQFGPCGFTQCVNLVCTP